MSNNFYLYVGTYLTCAPVKTKTTIVKYECSANCGVKHSFNHFNFCSSCGAPSVNKEESINSIKAINWLFISEQLEEKYREMLHAPEGVNNDKIAILIPNVRGFGITFSEFETSKALELNVDWFADENKKFLEAYKDLIEDLKNKTGIIPEVKNGIVPYYL